MSLYLVAGFSGPARTGEAKVIYCGSDQSEGIAEAQRLSGKYASFGRLANPQWIPVSTEPTPVSQPATQEKVQEVTEQPKRKPTLRQ